MGSEEKKTSSIKKDSTIQIKSKRKLSGKVETKPKSKEKKTEEKTIKEAKKEEIEIQSESTIEASNKNTKTEITSDIDDTTISKIDVIISQNQDTEEISKSQSNEKS